MRDYVSDCTFTVHPVIRPLVFIEVVETACKNSLLTPEFITNALKISSTYFLVVSYWSEVTGTIVLYKTGVFSVDLPSSSILTYKLLTVVTILSILVYIEVSAASIKLCVLVAIYEST